MSQRRIDQATSNDQNFLGINVGSRIDPRDAERLFENLAARFTQIAADQNAALGQQTSLLQESLRQQRDDARAGVRLQRQELNAQRAGLRDQRRLQEQGSLLAAQDNRRIQSFNQNQRNQAMSDYLRQAGQQQFSLTQAIQELLRS